MTNTLVSVIIPVYNVESYLRQCLDSVVGQSYKELEVLVIDDGSTDSSGIICDEYAAKDDRIRVFHTANRGLSAARNKGLDEATGDYISFIDSDDWFELDAIEKTVKEAIRTDADIICFRYIREYLDVSRIESVEYKEIRVFNGEEIIEEHCTGTIISGAVWDKLYRKQIFVDLRFPDGRLFEDIATTHLFLLKADKVVCIPDILIHYRARISGISRGHKLKHIQDQWLSSLERFDVLSRISKDYGDRQITGCIGSIGRMWSWYSSFRGEEKKTARSLMESMHSFSVDHRNDVKGNRYVSKFYRIVHFCSLTTNPLMMKLFYLFNQVSRCSRRKNRMFA